MKHSRAFTLIELSIVLVIIGLIVGGVLVGRDLIRAAEMRSIITDIERFKTATNTFRLKHDCIPGDCANATTSFGTDSLGCPVGGGSTGTCSGNGDSYLAHYTEGYRFWQQLALANLISGKYSGIQPATLALLFQSVPQSRVAASGYQIITESQASTGWTLPDGGTIEKTVIRFGSGCCDGSTPRIGIEALTGKETFSIDQKIDDGKPGSGIMWAHGVWVGSCMTTTDDTSTYRITQNTAVCLPQFTLNIQ